ncbi:hypothetical protein [Novosphingobium sp.]|uniref:hypothetical protein n=1 Tax=Novosphingobium sp. TaxID=1874826 RepID=UPI003B52C613
MIEIWPNSGGDEFAAVIDRRRRHRVLIVPPLFAEMNRMRRLIAGTMRALDVHGVDSFAPDLPGTNESTAPLYAQSLHTWRTAMERAAKHFAASHVLAVRGGALIFPNVLPGWALEPVSGAAILRQMVRARTVAARERGDHEDTAALIELGRSEGLMLAGYDLGPGLVAGLETARPLDEGQRQINQSDLGGAALWLRAEPGDDPAQALRLAQIIADGITA